MKKVVLAAMAAAAVCGMAFADEGFNVSGYVHAGMYADMKGTTFGWSEYDSTNYYELSTSYTKDNMGGSVNFMGATDGTVTLDSASGYVNLFDNMVTVTGGYKYANFFDTIHWHEMNGWGGYEGAMVEVKPVTGLSFIAALNIGTSTAVFNPNLWTYKASYGNDQFYANAAFSTKDDGHVIAEAGFTGVPGLTVKADTAVTSFMNGKAAAYDIGEKVEYTGIDKLDAYLIVEENSNVKEFYVEPKATYTVSDLLTAALRIGYNATTAKPFNGITFYPEAIFNVASNATLKVRYDIGVDSASAVSTNKLRFMCLYNF